MSLRSRLLLALFLLFSSQLLTPRLVVAQGTFRPPQTATPVPTRLQGRPGDVVNQQRAMPVTGPSGPIVVNRPPPVKPNPWWKWVPGLGTATLPEPPPIDTTASITTSATPTTTVVPCTWCLANLRRSVTEQFKAAGHLVTSLLPTQTPTTVAAPSPPAATECGILHLITCLTDTYSWVTGGYTRLESIIMKHVTRPRATSRTARARGAPAVISGDRTKGMCKQATNDFLVEAGLLCERIPGNHAFEAKNHLQNVLHLPNIEASIKRDPQGRVDPSTIPLNTILVYEDTRPPGKTKNGTPIPRSGHIEYKLSPDKYCSDFTSKFPISISNPQRRLIGAYKAPGCKK